MLSVLLTVSVFAACLVFSASAEEAKGANLLAGLHYTAEGNTRAADNLSDTNEDGTCKYRLTDGVFASENPGSDKVGAYGQGTVTFVFDLGESKEITSFHCEGYSGDWGITAPTSVEFLVSDDGTTYTSVGTVETTTEALEGNWAKHDFKLEKSAAGKFIKVVYNTASHVWVSEIEAFGKAAAGDTSTEPTSDASAAESTAASTAESSTGTAQTGDLGVAAIALLAIVAVGGAVAVKKCR